MFLRKKTQGRGVPAGWERAAPAGPHHAAPAATGTAVMPGPMGVPAAPGAPMEGALPVPQRSRAAGARSAARKLRHRGRHGLRMWLLLAILPPVPFAVHQWWPKYAWGAVAVFAAAGWWQRGRVRGKLAKQGRDPKKDRVFFAYTDVCTAAAAAWMTWAVFAGPRLYPLLALMIGWGVLAFVWWDYHRRLPPPAEPEPVPEPEPVRVPLEVRDRETFGVLAEQRRWSAELGECEHLPAGGRRYPIQCVGTKTNIRQIMGDPASLAAAYDSAVTEAYAERDKTGVESRGWLTILDEDTLHEVCEWNGTGIDPETGLGRVGRYADGLAAHIQAFIRGDGTRNGLVAGTTGAGKTRTLDLLMRLYLTLGFVVPVVLDPQQGQSLPTWRKHVIYGVGAADCLRKVAGLHAAMLDRSSRLGEIRWQDDDGHLNDGMDFYDPFTMVIADTGPHKGELVPLHTLMPIVLTIADEAPSLLTSKETGSAASGLIKDLAWRVRKAGCPWWLVAGLPSVSQLGDDGQAVRSALVGHNAIILRTAESVTQGMVNLFADPSELPQVFRDGSPTQGLGLLSGPDNRQAPFRMDTAPQWMRRQVPAIPPLDDRFREVMEDAQKPKAKPAAAGGTGPAVTPAAEAPVDDTAPNGLTPADAVVRVLKEACPGTLTRGEIIKAAQPVAAEWGRRKPFSIRGLGDAVDRAVADGWAAEHPAEGDRAPSYSATAQALAHEGPLPRPDGLPVLPPGTVSEQVLALVLEHGPLTRKAVLDIYEAAGVEVSASAVDQAFGKHCTDRAIRRAANGVYERFPLAAVPAAAG